MSLPSTKGAQGSVSPSQSSNTEPAPSGSRARSNNRTKCQPPTIHLSLKHSASRSRLSPNGPRSIDKPSSKPSATEGVSQQDARSPGLSPAQTDYFSDSPRFHSATYLHQLTASPQASPGSPSTFQSGPVSASLPSSVSALSGSSNFEPAQPKASGSQRQPPPRDHSLSAYLHPQSPPSHPYLTSSSPGSRKSSAISLIERDAIFHLDMKRFLSKPAPPSHSGSSIISVPSDPELAGSRSLRHPRSFTQGSPRSRTNGETCSPRRTTGDERVPLPARQASREPAFRASLPASPTTASRQSKEPEKEKKPRNVLRRKSSVKSNPSTPTAQTFKASQVDVPGTPRSAMKPSKNTTDNYPIPKRNQSAPPESMSVQSLKRHQSPPVGLTPAGAVAHAYKQQEQWREELAEISGYNEQVRQESSLRGITSKEMGADDEEGAVYYTVFGGSSGRVVALGRAEDSGWDVDINPSEGRATRGASSSTGIVSSSVRSLSRKVSGRFKKVAGAVTRDREASPNPSVSRGDRDWIPYDGRPSFQQERRSASLPKSRRRSLGTSLEEYVDVQSQVSSGNSIPSSQNGTAERPVKELKSMRSMRSVKGKEKESGHGKDEESSPSTKLWKLVKRISTGGLRDKYSRSGTPPPVPALPKGLQQNAPSRMTFDIREDGRPRSGNSVANFMQSRSSMSMIRPSVTPKKGPAPRADEFVSPRPSTGGKGSSSNPRPSTTTRSSSPMSSDIASSRFKAHSTRSSISSYGEELPPMPSNAANVSQHILSYDERERLGRGSEDLLPVKRIELRKRSQSQASVPLHSLPPPRRAYTEGKGKEDSVPPSPTIPAFSTADVVNDFSSDSPTLSLPVSEFGVLSVNKQTPTRPRRSSRRKAPPSELSSPASGSISASTSMGPLSPRTPRSPDVASISVKVVGISRSDTLGGNSSASSALQDSSYPTSPTSAASYTRCPLKFRDIESPRTRLSEKEKADRWEALLERSAKAGGTLHLGSSGLMSDMNVRYSDCSDNDL